MLTKSLHSFFSSKLTGPGFLFACVFLLSVTVSKGQVFTSIPAFNVYTTTGLTYSGCNSNASTIRTRVYSYSGTTVTIQVNKINGTSFGVNGILYLKQISPCSSSSLANLSFASTATNLYITLSLANLLQNQNIIFIPTVVLNNGTRLHTGTIKITNSCALFMQWYSQVNSAWGNDLMNNQCPIHQSGCVISCIAMVLASQVGNITSSYTPGSINAYLNSHAGYTGCSLNSWSLPVSMDGSGGVTYAGSNSTQNNWTWLDSQISQCRKIIVKVNNGSHWVLVTGRTGPSGVGSSYKVLDPGNLNYQQKTLANFSSTYLVGQSYAGTWKANMSYSIESLPTDNHECPGDEYETYQVDGTDGYLVCKSILLDVDNMVNTPSFKIFPNPVVTDQFTLEMDNLQEGKTTIMLTDLTGRIINQIQVGTGNSDRVFPISVVDLPSGLYLVTVKSETGGIATQKVQILR